MMDDDWHDRHIRSHTMLAVLILVNLGLILIVGGLITFSLVTR